MRTIILFCFLAILGLSSCGDGKTYAEIETDFGTMTVELYNSTPLHKENFIKLAKEGFYDDLLFHRVMNGFMVQGGDPNSKGAAPDVRLGSGGPGYKIPAEIGAPHFKGALAAARQPDGVNPEKMSSGSQFYVVHGKIPSDQELNSYELRKGFKYNEAQKAKYKEIGGTPMLDMDYTVFGEVIEGFDVIDKIAGVQTKPGDRPVEDVKMKIRIK
jgi:peptidyl-prolyl cis-trans isomerase B (cyclophilin B)